jgi:hypothetical protein
MDVHTDFAAILLSKRTSTFEIISLKTKVEYPNT